MIDIFLNSPYPATESIYSHELNAEGGKTLRIAFWKDDSTPYDLDNKTVTAAFVTNNTLIADNVAATDKSGNEFTLDISSNSNYTIIPGNMFVEFEIKEGNKVLTPATAMIVHVRGSIKNNAQVTPESYGTVSEILQEVANARGNYNNLPERLNAQDTDINSLKRRTTTAEEKISGIESVLPTKVNYVDLGNTSHNVFDVYTAENTIYHAKISEVGYEEIEYTFYTITNSTTERAQFRKSINGLEKRTYSNSEWSEFGTPLTFNAPNVTVWDYQTSQSNGFTVPTSFEGNLGDMVVITHGTGLGGEIHTLVRIIDSYGNKSYYWENTTVKKQIDELEEKTLVKPDYSLGFDTDGVIKSRANVTGLTTLLSGCDSVYTAPKCTTLTSQFKSVNPDLTDIYIDNYSEDMTIDSSITSDSNITIHYRATFKLIDLLTASQIALANRVGTVDTILGNAIEGVS